MSIHEGHRQRMRDRFLQDKALDNFTDIQALEFLLFYAIPRRDTNPLAHRLLDHFGSLPLVLDAPVEELENVPGMTHNAAVLLKLVTEMGRMYGVKRQEPNQELRTIKACGEYLVPRFFGRVHENVFLLCLDAQCRVISCLKVGEGSVNSANVPIRRVVEMALNAKATSVVLAHNHPSGNAVPSPEDIATTYRLAEALRMVDIILVDHIVVANDDFVSMVHSGHRFDGSGPR